MHHARRSLRTSNVSFASDAPSRSDLEARGTAGNEKVSVAHASAERAAERLGAHIIRKGATRGARDGAAVSAGALGTAWPSGDAADARARPYGMKSRRP